MGDIDKKDIDSPDEFDLANSKIDPNVLNNTNWLANAEKEIKKGYKEVKIKEFMIDSKPQDIVVRIYFPTIDEESEISDAYYTKHNELLFDDKQKTWEEILAKLNERKVWTTEDEEEFKKSDEIIGKWAEDIIMAQRTNFYNGHKITKAQLSKLKEKYYKDVSAIIGKQSIRNKYYIQSVESQANLHSTIVQLIKCLKWQKDGEWVPIWTHETLNQDCMYNKNVFKSLITPAVLFWRGQPQEILREPPVETQGETEEDGKVE